MTVRLRYGVAAALISLLASFSYTHQNATAAVSPVESRVYFAQSQFSVIVRGRLSSLTTQQINQYVKEAAQAVVAYYGFFPIKHTVVVITASNDDGVGFATSTHEDDPGYGLIEINIGADANFHDLDEDWTLTHEMMHLAFPIMSRKNRWIAEGIATYIEPIARMRTQKISKEEVWGDLYKNLNKGLPRYDDGGLNNCRDYGRVYWGGALYCLLADVQMRINSNNRTGLEQALRSIAFNGGTAASDWSAAEALSVADRSTGQKVLGSLYSQMSETPMTYDYRTLLRQLGVTSRQGRIYLDDRAPLAHVRRAIEGHP